MDIKKEYQRWLENATADADVATELKTLEDAKIEDAFYRDLAFGTGGLRGVIGAGTNRMNIYTVSKASQGLADYLKENFAEPSVAIGYDSRIKSDVSQGKIIACHGVGCDLRMYVQQSDFTIHSTTERLDQILKLDESCDYFYKIRIPQQIRKQLLVQLDAIGFHESSIYPDMEHIAREEANMYFNSKN